MIIFDYNIFFLQKYGGISRYFIELCKQMSNSEIDYLIQVTIHQNYYLDKASVNKSFNLYLKDYPKFTRKLIDSTNKYFFYKNINKNYYKIFHNTYYSNFKKGSNKIL